MKEIYICTTLYRIFKYEIPLEEIHSFMYFLKGCGAYEKYIKNIDINYIKYNINKKNKQVIYFKLIANSFFCNETEEGEYYWSVINRLHQIIIFYKVNENKLKFNDVILDMAHDRITIQFPKLYYNDMFDNIVFLYKSYNIKDKNLKHFIESLYEYVMKNS